MTIARCPACLTAFRVSPEQLRVRSGRVRCGHCYRPFNALDHLQPEHTPLEPTVEPPQTPGRRPTPGLDFEIPERFGPPRTTGIPPSAHPASPAQAADTTPAPTEAAEEPALRWKVAEHVSAEDAPRARNVFSGTQWSSRRDEHDRVEPSLDGSAGLPPPAVASIEARAAAAEVEDDLEQWRAGLYTQQPPSPHRWAWALGVGILLGSLVAQASYIYRGPITREWPQLRPVYLELCARLGCEVPLPRVPEALAVESSRLESIPRTARRFVLEAEVVNRASHPQQFPHLELTLRDKNDKPLARRAFAPAEWLPAGVDAEAGFAANASVSLSLPLTTAEQAVPAGYRINLFYP